MKSHILTSEELFSRLPLSENKIITIVGAGGKTTLLYALAKKLAANSQKVLATTTTHIMRPTYSPKIPSGFILEQENVSELHHAFSTSNLVYLGIPMTLANSCINQKEGYQTKWQSPSLDFLEKIRSVPDYILCEGDGSRRLPVKIPRKKEPVLYPGTEMVIGIIGLSCLGQPVKNNLFGWKENPSFFQTLLSSTEGTEHRITTDTLFQIALSPEGLQKSTENRVFHVVLNQADTMSYNRMTDIELLSQKIRDNGIPCHIVSLKNQNR